MFTVNVKNINGKVDKFKPCWWFGCVWWCFHSSVTRIQCHACLFVLLVNGTPGSQLSTPRSGKSPSPSPTSPGSLRKQRVRTLKFRMGDQESNPNTNIAFYIVVFFKLSTFKEYFP